MNEAELLEYKEQECERLWTEWGMPYTDYYAPSERVFVNHIKRMEPGQVIVVAFRFRPQIRDLYQVLEEKFKLALNRSDPDYLIVYRHCVGCEVMVKRVR